MPSPKLAASELVNHVEFQREVDFFETNALLYAEESELVDLEQNLEKQIREAKLKENPLYIDLDDDDDDDKAEGKGSSLDLGAIEDKYEITNQKRYYTNDDETLLVVTVYPAGENTNVAFARRLLGYHHTHRA